MCVDYLLMKLSNRLVLEGEDLVAHKFWNGSIGLLARSDFESWRTGIESALAEASMKAVQPPRNLWQSMKDSLLALLTYFGFLDIGAPCSLEPGPLVAVPPEALLRVFDISEDLQRQYHLKSVEDALFTTIGRPTGFYRNALYFGNGVIVPLQQLDEGQRIRVLRRSWAESFEASPEPANVKASRSAA